MQLSPLVRLVRAPNPSPFTLSGTNSYLIGNGPELIALDPGPDLPEHVDALLAAAGDQQITQIIVTHSHRDHLPGALLLRERTGATLAGWGTIPEIDRQLGDGDTVEIDAVRLTAIFTPGHAVDHHCFLLEPEDALFTGDMVLGYGSVVVAPPGGDMTDYLASLARLQAVGASRIYPGHGPTVDDPAAKLAEYVDHRLQREQQVLDGLAAGDETEQDLVKRNYSGLDDRLVRWAGLSMRAHLLKLERENRVQGEGADEARHWRLVAGGRRA